MLRRTLFENQSRLSFAPFRKFFALNVSPVTPALAMAGVRYFAKPGSRSTAPNINLLYELKDDIMHDM